MKNLLEGYRRFRTKEWVERRSAFKVLAEEGQSPTTLVIACADSRVDPAMIFDVPPGEVFTIRNVANLIPPYAPDVAYHGTSAGVEFAVRVLNVSDIIVLGHGKCGGIHALLEGTPENAQDFVRHWIEIAASARAAAKKHTSSEDQHKACEHEVVKISLANLRTFPWIAAREKAGKIRLHGAWFDIRDGVLAVLGEDGKFDVVE